MVGTAIHGKVYVVDVENEESTKVVVPLPPHSIAKKASVVVHAKTWGRRRLQNKAYASIMCYIDTQTVELRVVSTK
jgi:hypothetical protein